MQPSNRAIGVKSATNRTFFLMNSSCSQVNQMSQPLVKPSPSQIINQNRSSQQKESVTGFFMSRLWRGINCTGGEYHSSDNEAKSFEVNPPEQLQPDFQKM